VYFLLSIWGAKAPICGDKVHSTAGGSLFYLIAALMMGFYGDTVTFGITRSLGAKDALNFPTLVYAGF